MTIYLCPPGAHAAAAALAEEYAIRSGWQALAEESGSVLVVPLVPEGWEKEPKSLLKDIYKETKNQFLSRSGEAIWGRSGRLWCWETMLYLVGYEDGAVFAGNVLSAHPNMFAAAALVDGTPDDDSAGEEYSDHWLVPGASEATRKRNREIPVHLWLCRCSGCDQENSRKGMDSVQQNCADDGSLDDGADFALGQNPVNDADPASEKSRVRSERQEEAARYFSGSFGSCVSSAVRLPGWSGEKIVSEEHPAHQVWMLTQDEAVDEKERNRTILKECFEHVIRWKNTPDGTLALRNSKKEFYNNPAFQKRTVDVDGRSYDYFIHLPVRREDTGRSNQSCKDGAVFSQAGSEQNDPGFCTASEAEQKGVKKLPLVFTVHGRGEPAWLFTTKNGWDTLADETGEFILVSPDSPGNIWFLPRDGAVFPAIVCDMAEHYPIDTERIYLTGFSNGGMMVREVAVRYPELFAGVSPWNAPVGNTGAMMKADSNDMAPQYDEEFTAILQNFLKSGYEMPCAFIFGDQDNAANAASDLMVQPMLTANGCLVQMKENGDRYTETFYQNEEGVTMVTVTVMKDMPHGALLEESRHTWEFLKQFSRKKGNETILIC
ncbi:MAG: prolyl oligopeptidase family serine peptidase [Lachnospiraceae bacterium]|nr:prolyl oligopeptidase family serine peptidase [Lachnospiraceae bacterium]